MMIGGDTASAETSAMLWSDFWRTGTRDGCTAAFPPHAQALILARWRALFDACPANTRVLDVACGRGAVMAIAADAGLTSRTGVDIAAADALDAGGERILAGIDARALPFSDRAFDLVVSQFGLEYAGLADALAEAGRVAGRELAVLLHAADGDVVGQALEQARQAMWIDRELDGFGALARGGAELEAVLRAVAAAGETAGNTALLEAFYHNARAFAAQPDPALATRFATDWRAHAARMSELGRAAPNAAAADAAAALLDAQGFETALSELRVDGALIGRWLSARRGAARQGH